MADFDISVTERDMREALRAFIVRVLPDDVEVVQTQDNSVPAPISKNFVTMTQKGRARLSTNVGFWDFQAINPSQLEISAQTRITVQLDIYGPMSADYAQILSTLLRDQYAVDNFPDGVQPLYATDGSQMPHISGEEKYISRWMMDVALHSAPVIFTPQQFMDIVGITLQPVKGA